MSVLKGLTSSQTWKRSLTSPKADWSSTIASSVVDAVSGIIGATGGSFMGFWSVPVGVVAIGTGHKLGQRWLTSAGIGCLAAPFDVTKIGMRTTPGTGFDMKAEFEAGKERLKDYIEQLKSKFTFGKYGSPSVNQSPGTGESDVKGFGNAPSASTLEMLTRMDELAELEAERAAANGTVFTYGQPERPVSGIGDFDVAAKLL
ncbi:MAG: hypothetical protein MUC87_20885 [Bacteroidia bacterium]|jgi:hypothetical protein|nr:hypothetical protein [Bacteroidia bacterium]